MNKEISVLLNDVPTNSDYICVDTDLDLEDKLDDLIQDNRLNRADWIIQFI